MTDPAALKAEVLREVAEIFRRWEEGARTRATELERAAAQVGDVRI